jgi:hypothetical protein
MHQRTPTRGSILLETLLSIVLFVAAATFTLGALRNALESTARSALKAKAADAARSLLSELEAGIIGEADLARERDRHREDGMILEATSERSSFPDLVFVEITVREDVRELAGEAGPRLFVLRQLVRLPRSRGSGDDP